MPKTRSYMSNSVGDKRTLRKTGDLLTRMMASAVAVLLALTVAPAQTLAGGFANRVVISGPGMQADGVAIRGCWPGHFPFADIRNGAVAEPPAELARYVLSGDTERGEAFTILYVRDAASGQAFVYLPALDETSYPQRLNEQTRTHYGDHAGKWYPFFNLAQFARWDELIGKAVAQSGASEVTQ